MLTNELRDWQFLIAKGQSLYQQRDFVGAEQCLRQAVLVAQSQSLQPEYLAGTISNLAAVKEAQGIYLDAKTLYAQSLEIMRGANPKNDENIARILNKLEQLNQALATPQVNHNFRPVQSTQLAMAPQGVPSQARSSDAVPSEHTASQQEPSDCIRNRTWVNPNPISLQTLVTQKERVYGTMSLVFGIACWLLSFLLAFGFAIVPFVLLTTLVSQGLFIGWIKSSAVRISDQQLPELKAIIEDICAALEMPVPAVYIANGEGMLNAFATRFLSRNFVVIYSNILEMAFEKGKLK